jgi:ABC-type transport system involved in multi-copper enzyme maturation permease subunit
MATAVAGGSARQVLPAPRGRVGLGGALRSEFTKIRSVRSTYWTLLAMVVVTAGFGALAAAGAASHASQLDAGFDATQRSLAGLYISQLIIAVLGALAITSEYSTGMIRTSLAAQPRRGTVFAAKTLVFAAVALVSGLVTSFLSFFLGQALMSGKHINATLGQPHVLRAVIGGGLFLAACGLLAYGLGMIFRHTAGAITAAIGLLFVLTVIVTFLPESWQEHINKWTPAIAGSEVWAVKQSPDAFNLGAWQGFGVLCAYAAVALVLGLVVFLRRDA